MSEDNDNLHPVGGVLNGENALPDMSKYSVPTSSPSEPAVIPPAANNVWQKRSTLVPHFFAICGPETQSCPVSLGQNLFPDDDSIFFGLNCEAKMHKQHLKALNNPALFKQYRLSQRKYFDIMSIVPLTAIYLVAAASRFNLQNTGRSGPLFDASFVLFLMTVVTFFMFLIPQCIVCHTSKNNYNRRSYQISERCLKNWFGGRIADILGLFGVLSMGFHLLARVNAGQCKDISDIWSSQSCNPVASLRALPHDEILLLYAIPLSAQIAFRGITVEALAICWVFVIFFVLYSLIRVEGWIQLWTVLYSIIFINISFEIERLMRVTFVQTRAMLAAERSKLIRDLQLEAEVNLTKLRNRHELEIVEVSAENERKLREKENFQLRSLMGNVAHDLKTPLHSIEADLEVLNVFISKIPKHLLEKTTAEFQSKAVGESFDPHSVFDSLSATCKFMEMAINRSQDFMKASNNIALVPVMETFELKTALAMSVTCINHLQSARAITLHPYDSSICSHLISDKHWLIENSLCLLSNAMKYSDDGVVDIRIALIDVPDSRTTQNRPGLSASDNQSSRFLLKTAAGSYDSDTVSISILPASANARDSNLSDVSKSAKKVKMIQISVEDTGIGISEESRKNLFQPFKQAQRMAGGTGLGLYSLSKRIEALGGSAGVTSRADGMQGSMFWFTFPYRPDEETARTDVHVEAQTKIDSSVVDLLDSIQSRKILIVDDSLSILKVTSRLLKMNGHSVETASNGSIGLKRLKEAYDSEEFDMILTDLQMPVMDGVEATSRFRKFENDQMLKDEQDPSKTRKKRMLIVGMSANSDFQSKQEALNSGMDYFVTKPFAYKDLQPILQNEMENT